MVKHIGVGNFCTFRVASLMRTNIFEAAVFLLTETLVRSVWRGRLPVLVIISQEDGSGVPLTPTMDLGPAVMMVANTEPFLTTRVCRAGS